MMPVSILMAGMEGFSQALDQKGEELFSSQGVQIIRLSSDPDGNTLYIHNSGPHMIHISTFGHIKADGLDYSENTPIYADVSSGKSAYTKLFGYLPGYTPDAEELSFYISIIDREENSLITRSDKITLSMPKIQN